MRLARWKIGAMLAVASIGISLVTLGGLAGADSDSGQSLDGVGAESTTIVATFTSAQDGGTTVGVTDHGNMIRFESPAGYEHILPGVIHEEFFPIVAPKRTPPAALEALGDAFRQAIQRSAARVNEMTGVTARAGRRMMAARAPGITRPYAPHGGT